MGLAFSLQFYLFIMIKRLLVVLNKTLCALILLFAPFVTYATILTELEAVRFEALRQKKVYLPKYIEETNVICSNDQNTTAEVDSCLQKLLERSKAVLSCESSRDRWNEMSRLDRNSLLDTLKNTPQVDLPPFVKNIFDAVVVAAQKLTSAHTPAVPAKFLALPFQWELHAYTPKAINAQATAGGDVLIASQLWETNTVFSENDIRAILAHEVAHVILNHSLQMGCLGLEWNQGVGSLENASTIFSEDMFGSFPLGQSRQTLSKRNELIADEYAVYILKIMNRPARDMTDALIKLRDALPSKGFNSGSHPDFEERIEEAQRL